jgi:cytochrome P450
MGDQELRDELMTLLVAGHETTATALSWAIERLVRHPQALADLRDDLDAGSTTYLEAVIHETLRLRPVLPVVVRDLQADTEIGGRHLPGGTRIAVSITLAHRNPDVYPDPHAFRPERWLGTKPGTYTWIPFGGGIRRCLGASFALFEMQQVLPAVVGELELQATDPRPERVARRAITLTPARRAEVVVEGRRARPARPAREPEAVAA